MMDNEAISIHCLVGRRVAGHWAEFSFNRMSSSIFWVQQWECRSHLFPSKWPTQQKRSLRHVWHILILRERYAPKINFIHDTVESQLEVQKLITITLTTMAVFRNELGTHTLYTYIPTQKSKQSTLCIQQLTINTTCTRDIDGDDIVS